MSESRFTCEDSVCIIGTSIMMLLRNYYFDFKYIKPK